MSIPATYMHHADLQLINSPQLLLSSGMSSGVMCDGLLLCFEFFTKDEVLQG